MTHQGQIIGCTESGRTAADDRHLLAGCRLLLADAELGLMLYSILLQTADIDGIVHHRSAASDLTGVFTDHAADSREGIILPDERNGIIITSIVNKGDISRNIHVGGTLGNTGYGLILMTGTAAVQYMLLIVITESADSLQHHACRFGTDGAVSGIINALRSLLDDFQCLHRSFAIQY